MTSVRPRDQAEDENQTILIMAKSAPKYGLNSIYHKGLIASPPSHADFAEANCKATQ